MNDHARLRRALDDLAAEALPARIVPAEVTGLAYRLRWRRRYRLAAACSVVAIGVAALVAADRPGASGLSFDPAPPAAPPGAPTSPPGSRGPTPAPSYPAASPSPGETRVSGSGSPSAYAESPSPYAGSPSPDGSPSPYAESPSPSPDGSPSPSPLPETSPREPVCNLLVDQPGDAGPLATESQDIVSGDVASGKAHVSAVVRVKSLANATQPTGASWGFGWRAGKNNYTFVAERDSSGNVAGTLEVTNGGTPVVSNVSVKLDADAGTITWFAYRKLFPDLMHTEGVRFTGLHAYTTQTATDVAADDATSDATYDDRYPSCLPAK